MPPKELPKEWQKHHDEWLNCTMCMATDDTMIQGIPTLDNIYCILCPDAINELNLELSQMFITWYDLRIHTKEGENQVEQFHQAFTKWFQKVREVDAQAILYPWMAT